MWSRRPWLSPLPTRLQRRWNRLRPPESRMRRITCSIALVCLLVGSRQSVALEEAEQRARIALEVQQFEERIGNSGNLFEDAALDAYLQGVIERLFPDKAGQLHVRAFSDSEFNAFALPNGSIYFNTGALLRMQDEAQLASVLGHEGAHVTGDHGFRSVTSQKRTLVAANVLLIANPLLALAVGVSSLAGYSRDLEREADDGGFKRMVRAGYVPSAGLEVFARMDRELAARKIRQGAYFYASHPRMKERVSSFASLAAELPAEGDRNNETFLAVTLKARLHAVAQIHKRGDGTTLVFLLESERLLDTLPATAGYYLGEGYRLRNQPGDAELALQWYLRTLEAAPGFAATYQALGMMHFRAGRKAEALPLLERFVELDPQALQAGYARQYIDQLRKELQP